MRSGKGKAEELFKDAHVIFNGAHTLMGHWNLLGKRFECLSKNKRFLIYATNNFKDKKVKKEEKNWCETALVIYFNGKKLEKLVDVCENKTGCLEITKWPEDLKQESPVRGLLLKTTGAYFN